MSDSVSFTALSRFRKYFGDTSSEVSAGDFKIVLLDTVSLSAEERPSIFRHPQQFLESLRSSKPATPRILLTHVPLYRPRGTTCGPLRESKTPIRSGKGYQYQNILKSGLSKKVVDVVHPVVVFSGDDHDYCYVEHDYGGLKIPEHTVKSFSWAMVYKAHTMI
jgi:ethanolamine phosphate phosphodiesterase